MVCPSVFLSFWNYILSDLGEIGGNSSMKLAAEISDTTSFGIKFNKKPRFNILTIKKFLFHLCVIGKIINLLSEDGSNKIHLVLSK